MAGRRDQFNQCVFAEGVYQGDDDVHCKEKGDEIRGHGWSGLLRGWMAMCQFSEDLHRIKIGISKHASRASYLSAAQPFASIDIFSFTLLGSIMFVDM